MKILALVFLTYIFQCQALGPNNPIESYWCSSCDDPHIHTSDGLPYEFQFSGNFYILYTDYSDTTVTASYRPCNKGASQPTCNCGIHVKYQGDTLFLDTCGVYPNNTLNFFSVQSPSLIPQLVQCGSKIIPFGKETDDSWWNTPNNAVSIPGNKIKCAATNAVRTFIIRTNNADNNKNIYVKLMLHAKGISCTYVRPAVASYGKVGGLCGNFNDNMDDDQFCWQRTGTPDGTTNGGYTQVPASTSQLKSCWILQRNATTEEGYKKLDTHTCLCDTVPPASNTDCAVPLPVCVSNLYNKTVVQQDYVNDQPARKVDMPKTVLKCQQRFEEGKLNAAVQNGLLDWDTFGRLQDWCLLDYSATGDDTWVINLVQIGRNEIIDTCGETQSTDPLCQDVITPVYCTLPGVPASLLTDCRKGCPAK